MSRRLTPSDGQQALHEHLLGKAAAARARHGPDIGPDEILRILDDRACVRYPTGIRFTADGLSPGEFAYALPLGDSPARGFCILIHPSFESRRELWPLLIAYHIPPINYGDIVTSDDCELFGATLLGLDVQSYYQSLCALADALPPPAPKDPA